MRLRMAAGHLPKAGTSKTTGLPVPLSHMIGFHHNYLPAALHHCYQRR
jgi:hypothetical protein